jgi:hypothetical protein
LSVGAETNSVGNYILNSGTLQVAGEEDIGISGSGTFTQTGGTNTIQTYLDIGYYYESGGVYYLGGTGQVTFSNPGGSVYVGGSSVGQADGGELSVSGGSIQIPHILEIYSFGDITQTGGTITAGATVNTGVINQSGGRAILGSVTGVNGELIIGAASGASAATTVNALNQYKAIINSTGFLTINGGTANNLGSLSISGNGQLDVTNHHLFINYAAAEDPDPIASIAAWIASGYAGGTWNGPGIMSTAAQANSGRYGIGYADSADPGNPAGLSSGQIEIMYTLLGDANLDGKVNGTDFNLMAANFNQAVTHGWDEGDFNYDGKVNGSDFVLLANNFNQFASQSAVSSADVNALDAFAAANGISLVNVPEPLSAGMMVIAGLGILNRRRRINC